GAAARGDRRRVPRRADDDCPLRRAWDADCLVDPGAAPGLAIRAKEAAKIGARKGKQEPKTGARYGDQKPGPEIDAGVEATNGKARNCRPETADQKLNARN